MQQLLALWWCFMDALLIVAQVAFDLATSGPVGATVVACCIACPGLSIWTTTQTLKLAWKAARSSSAFILAGYNAYFSDQPEHTK